jgi:hypothetical protein
VRGSASFLRGGSDGGAPVSSRAGGEEEERGEDAASVERESLPPEDPRDGGIRVFDARAPPAALSAAELQTGAEAKGFARARSLADQLPDQARAPRLFALGGFDGDANLRSVEARRPPAPPPPRALTMTLRPAPEAR